MIVRVNPWVELYTIRFQDSVLRSGGRGIFAASAAEAIRKAVELRVNIISMSWIIKNRAPSAAAVAVTSSGPEGRNGSVSDRLTAEQSDVRRLEEAIDAAKKAGILMFYSASDDIQAGAMDTLPYRRQPDHIFRIGAALSLGQRDPHSEDVKRIDYYFPGNQVAEARNPRSLAPVRHHNGSSVGTALAAGLASLIMYCARLAVHHKEDEKAQKRPYAGLDAALQVHSNMRQALDNIKSNDWEDKKYLPVWAVFQPRAEEIIRAKGEEKWNALEKLVIQLGQGMY